MDVCTQFATIFDVLLFTVRKSNEIYLMHKFRTEFFFVRKKIATNCQMKHIIWNGFFYIDAAARDTMHVQV